MIYKNQFPSTYSLKNEINLLSGEVQENGLSAGWITAIDTFDCAIKLVKGAIYFGRQTISEKCSFAFNKNAPNGNYLLITDFEIDGNGAGIFLDGKLLKKQHAIKVTDGKIRFRIQTRGGKAWGWIIKMTIFRTK